jgi:hypothetical protein
MVKYFFAGFIPALRQAGVIGHRSSFPFEQILCFTGKNSDTHIKLLTQG